MLQAFPYASVHNAGLLHVTHDDVSGTGPAQQCMQLQLNFGPREVLKIDSSMAWTTVLVSTAVPIMLRGITTVTAHAP